MVGAFRLALRLEGVAILVFAVGLYLRSGGSAWLRIPLVLAVDLSMAGYLVSPMLGAVTYNALRSWAPGFAVLAFGVVAGADVVITGGAVLVAHVGIDGMAGSGLRYPTAFADTHLGRIGRSR